MSPVDGLSPVEWIATDPHEDKPELGCALFYIL
jgi:hypothetical protein